MNYTDYISIDPNIRFGKPCVKGTRIAVSDVVGWLRSDTIADVLNYPELSAIQIEACIAYAAENDISHPRNKQPAKLSKKRSGMGSLKGKIKMGDDFDEPLEDFEPYM